MQNNTVTAQKFSSQTTPLLKIWYGFLITYKSKKKRYGGLFWCGWHVYIKG